jgi:polyisoprenoid-binding protein YceI
VTRRIAAGLSLCALCLPLAAAPEHFTLDPVRTVPSFEVSRFAIPPLRGHFAHVTGHISLDREARTGSIAIEIDATSVSIGRGWFDSLIKGEDFFDIAQYPRLRFRAERLEFEGDRPVRAEGQLTLRGVTHPVTLELRQFACARTDSAPRMTCAADIFARISRSAFGMTSYAAFVGDEVRLMIQVEAVKQGPVANTGG